MPANVRPLFQNDAGWLGLDYSKCGWRAAPPMPRPPSWSSVSNRDGNGLSRSMTAITASVAQNRHNQFRPAIGIASNVTGKGVDVIHQLARRCPRRCAAHAFVQRDTDARSFALKRAEYQFIADHPVKSGPVQVRQKLPQQRRDVRHIGNAIWLASRQGIGGFDQLFIEFGFGPVGGRYRMRTLRKPYQSSATLPRPFLTSPRPFLASTRRAFAALPNFVLQPRRLANKGLVDHFDHALAAHRRDWPRGYGGCAQ